MKRVLVLILAIGLLTACGQKASTRGGAVTPAPVESGSGMMMAHSASDLHCGKEAPVWVNSKTHVYHMKGDPYYGHTKAGGYLCEQDAVRAGMRASKNKY